MPYIECHIATGLTKARKTQLIRDIVKVTHESIGSDPKIINVLLFEHPADNMSISGRIHGEETATGRAEARAGQSQALSTARRAEPDRLSVESSSPAMQVRTASLDLCYDTLIRLVS
jgi:4-oxalocrotonate tautomerase/trans-3-chloroacrylic acid dehalogenase beta subunit